MRLDMLKVACILERWDGPIQLAHPAVKVRVPIPDGADVAFEVTDVDWVETDLCGFAFRMMIKRRKQKRRTMVTKSLMSASVRRLPMR